MRFDHKRDWRSFADCAALLSNTEHVIFRGMASSDWLPTCSYERVLGGLELSRGACGKMAIRFQHGASAMGFETVQSEAMLVAQHWGLPTRLIDFSVSPFVAAFFAARSWLDVFMRDRNLAMRSLPTVWALNVSDNAFESADGDPVHPIVEFISSVESQDTRIRAQRGVFVLHHSGKNLVEALTQMGESDRLVAYTFPAADGFQALKSLDKTMLINDRTMFPGIEGLVRSLVADAVLEASA